MEHMKNFKPKSCPFCGHPEVTNQIEYPHRVVCGNFKCRAIGPDHLFRLSTRDAWNERAEAERKPGAEVGREVKPRPKNCPDVVHCGWHHVETEPDVNLYLCGNMNCPHTPAALSASPRTRTEPTAATRNRSMGE